MRLRTFHCLLALLLSLTLFGCDTSSISESAANSENSNTGGTSSEPNPHEQTYAVSDSSSVPQSQSEGGSMDDSGISGPEDPNLPPTAPSEGDQYEDIGANPFTVVTHDPQSTFGVDVDTASYDLFRRDTGNYGWLPHEAGVRLEEYVNNFDYDYAAPKSDSELPFAVSVEASPSPYRDVVLMRIGIRGQDAPIEDKKAANVVFLVDVSGSMSSNLKLPLVKTVLKETVTMLEPTDTISIVTYAGQIGVRLEPTPASEVATIFEAIETMKSGGGTSGAAGLELAYEQAESAFIEGGINHIVLCSDGDFNIGPSSDEALVALIEEKRETGITMTVLGFGSGNLNDSMMEKVSNAGNGVYGVIANQDHAISYVHNKLLSTMFFIAKDVKIQVDFNSEKVLAYRLLGYENRAIADHLFEDHTVDAGEIGAGHTVTALYEIVLNGDAIPQAPGMPDIDDGDAFDGELEVESDELCRVKIRYKFPEDGTDDPSMALSYGVIDKQIADHIEDTSGDFQFATAVSGLAEHLRLSPFALPGDFEHIRSLAEQNVDGKADREEFIFLLDKAQPLLTQEPTLDTL
jgi:Ca-activated chloride channel family protein